MIDSIRVFVVEDELLIQDLVGEELEGGGFAVITADNGEEAMAMMELDGAKFRVLVSDVNLGGWGRITGWEVAKRARQINHQLAVVYMTGGSGHEWASEGVPNSLLIKKPFVPVQIVTAVAKLLNTSGT
jgi:CheY-like chemotaxis protein